MRPFLGIYCAPCRVYFRIYLDWDGKRYTGRCPKCGRYALARVDPRYGCRTRFFIGR